jgi:hypothetical protein
MHDPHFNHFGPRDPVFFSARLSPDVVALLVKLAGRMPITFLCLIDVDKLNSVAF